MSLRLLVQILGVVLAGAAQADDDAVAHRLFEEGRYAEAAELFGDPAWKGAAFYRSDQYWRAAEAFLRAGDPRSTYNLGNAYARLGYFELALQAYLGTLAADPSHQDARFNADLMREALGNRDSSGQQGISPQAQAIDEVEATGKEDEGAGEPGEDDGRREQGMPAEAPPPAGGGREEKNASTDSGGDGTGGGKEEEMREGEAAARSVDGTASGAEQEATDRPAGGRSGDERSPESETAGMRARLETEQATEQWLNRIVDDPGRFLSARIALESRRRRASGTAVETEDDAW